MTIRGTATLRIPTSLRIVEADVVGRDALELTEGPLRVTYGIIDNQATYEWGIPEASCCASPRAMRRLPLSPGMVQLFDTSGRLEQEVALAGSYRQWHKLGFRLLDLGNTHTFQPGTLRWTFAPTVEEIEVPVVFEEVRFTPRAP